MKTLYLECGMGAAGSMLTAALLELLPNPDAFIEELNALGIPCVQFRRLDSVRCGIRGTGVLVSVNGVEEKSEDCDIDLDEELTKSDALLDSIDENASSDEDEEISFESDRRDESSRPYARGRSRGRNLGDRTHYRSSSPRVRHEHKHTSLTEIHQILEKLPVSSKVLSDIRAIYDLLAEAESLVHNVPVTEIHFHEVGNLDAIADITAFCMLIERLAPEKIVASPIHVGSGKVRCSHGILPVPAPATAHLLRDIPVFSGRIRGELCTPTGAAILKHFVSSFGPMPVMSVKAVGYGMGRKKFPSANCLRAFWGVEEDENNIITTLECNLDDMTAEAVGFAMEQLFDAGALDAYTTPITMKKSRPGIILTVHCNAADKDRILHLIFKHTTTLGVRENISQRHTLQRTMALAETPYGNVHCKVSTGYGVTRSKYEYEDLASIARDRRISLADALSLVEHSNYENR